MTTLSMTRCTRVTDHKPIRVPACADHKYTNEFEPTSQVPTSSTRNSWVVGVIKSGLRRIMSLHLTPQCPFFKIATVFLHDYRIYTV